MDVAVSRACHRPPRSGTGAHARPRGGADITDHDDDELHYLRPAHAVPLASAHQRPENQKENQAGHSSERAVEGLGGKPVLVTNVIDDEFSKIIIMIIKVT